MTSIRKIKKSFRRDIRKLVAVRIFDITDPNDWFLEKWPKPPRIRYTKREATKILWAFPWLFRFLRIKLVNHMAGVTLVETNVNLLTDARYITPPSREQFDTLITQETFCKAFDNE